MYYTAGVKVAEAFSSTTQLKASYVSDNYTRENTYKSKSVCIGVSLDVFQHIPVMRPFRNKLEGRDSDTQKR